MNQKKIYVGNLAYTLTEEGIKDIFSQFGEITDINLVIDRETNRSKGFAFIEFESQQSAQEALSMDGKEIEGRNLKVSMVKEQKGGRGSRSGGSRSGGYNNDYNRNYN